MAGRLVYTPIPDLSPKSVRDTITRYEYDWESQLKTSLDGIKVFQKALEEYKTAQNKPVDSTKVPDKEVMAGTGKIEKAEFKSSSGNAVYVAWINTETGETSCNCKGWTFKRTAGPRTCKHTKELEARFEVRSKKFDSEIKAATPGTMIVDEVAANEPSPMLASAMPDSKTIEDYCNPKWVLEEKLDGHRILITVKDGKATAKSRPGATHGANERNLPEHISEAMGMLPDGIYDGELYIPGGTSTDVVRLDIQDQLVFGIFDILESTGAFCNLQTYTARRELLDELFWISNLPKDSGVFIIPNKPVSRASVQKIWDNGGEGAILKNIDSSYAFGKRVADWVKVKKTEAATLTIKGFQAGKLGPNSIAELEDSKGLKTTIKVLNSEILRDIDKDPKKYIGKKLVISYMGKTSQGSYKHGVWDHVL